MASGPVLECRKLSGSDLELLDGLISVARNGEESFGLESDQALPELGEPWGGFIRGGLSAAAWLKCPPGNGPAEISALLVARNWLHTGISSFLLNRMLGEIGPGGVRIRLAGGKRGLGEVLEAAGFLGPDPEDRDYPRGEWNRPGSAS
ncbi:MAG: hypothetical protein LBU64_12050 [Planctomycetota bacterium]|jgi:hypothetical protein|nr:hypothetical protein [Planctomycetota bacterium]